jgi:TolB-like protein
LQTTGDAVNLAVLPFEVLGGADAALQRALNEALVAWLSKSEGVRVLSPSTVARYQATNVPPHIMARLLGVDATVEGVVQRSGSGVRGTARLNDVRTGKVIWSGTFESVSPAPEREAAGSISAAMGPHLAVHRGPAAGRR